MSKVWVKYWLGEYEKMSNFKFDVLIKYKIFFVKLFYYRKHSQVSSHKIF